MTEGISRAIGELAAAQRLSATSVMVNSPHWPAAAPRLRAHRGHLSIGLHLNLTLGTPVGPMPRLAPAGTFPGLRGADCAGVPRPPRWRRDPGRDRAPARSLRGGAAIPSRPYRRASAHPCVAQGERRAPAGRATALFGKTAAAPRSDRRARGHRRSARGGAQGHVGLGPRARLCARGAPARAAGQRQLCRLLRLRREGALRRRAAQRAAAAGPAASRHVPSGPPRRRACPPRSRGGPAAHGIRRDHARSRPAPAHLAAFAQRRWAGDLIGRSCETEC